MKKNANSQLTDTFYHNCLLHEEVGGRKTVNYVYKYNECSCTKLMKVFTTQSL